ncbi:TetR/AcrR family transcriptional regulator [Tsukamurella soli]|uniref:TetR/AcrR family transcriptional regulator n=1 Tax=Tsukamurella soli TaxID=644556 RepID=A0ABP8JQN5_9ACTN
MGRPTLHDRDALLDAAIRLFARDGARGLTVAAVAREAGAPSGSVYHRFPDRPTLLASVWLRTVRRFHEAYVEAAAVSPSPSAAVAAVAWTVEWCRAHLEEALVLQAGVTAFAPGEWRADSVRDWNQLRDRQSEAIDIVVRSVAAQSGRSTAEVGFAMFDLPLAVVRRHLLTGSPPPAESTGLARGLAAAILLAGSTREA